MASLKDLKTRINSVKSTQKITAAMKMVAAAKLRRAQEAAEAGRPYADRMRGVIANLAAKLIPARHLPCLSEMANQQHICWLLFRLIAVFVVVLTGQLPARPVPKLRGFKAKAKPSSC